MFSECEIWSGKEIEHVHRQISDSKSWFFVCTCLHFLCDYKSNVRLWIFSLCFTLSFCWCRAQFNLLLLSLTGNFSSLTLSHGWPLDSENLIHQVFVFRSNYGTITNLLPQQVNAHHSPPGPVIYFPNSIDLAFTLFADSGPSAAIWHTGLLSVPNLID